MNEASGRNELTALSPNPEEAQKEKAGGNSGNKEHVLLNDEPKKQPQKSDQIVSNPTLFNNFWLNEIKSIDDSSRILMSFNILLLSAYFTIIAANFEKITGMLTVKSLENYSRLLSIFLPSFFCWFHSITMSMGSHVIPLDGEPLLYKDLAKRYILMLYKYKHYRYVFSCILLAMPFAYYSAVIFILILTTILIPSNAIRSQESLKYLSDFGLVMTIIVIMSNYLLEKKLSKMETQADYQHKSKAKHWWQFCRKD